MSNPTADPVEELLVAVRADTQGFAQDIQSMRAQLDGPLASGLDKANTALEKGLVNAIAKGKLSFDDLRKTALAALSDIAAGALQAGIGSLFPTGSAATGGGILGTLTGLVGSVLGLPGRATGGPVGPGRAYLVGENGPELFVPTSSGAVQTLSGGGTRPVAITVNVTGTGGDPRALERSAGQVARSVSRALDRAGG